MPKNNEPSTMPPVIELLILLPITALLFVPMIQLIIGIIAELKHQPQAPRPKRKRSIRWFDED